MQLTGKTQVVGVFGDPIAHSLSPRMQNAAIQASGLNAVYVPFHVTPAQLCDAIKGIRAMELRGVNLTIPHKETACSLVDEIDPQAKLIGAINTIVNDSGRLKGYNTDVLGLSRVLKEGLGLDLKGRRVMILGAGGASRAATVAVCQSGAQWVGITNRTRERAKSLIQDMAKSFPGTTFADYPLSDMMLGECTQSVDLLINASAVGLKGEAFDVHVVGCVKDNGAVYDMTYAPEPTPLMRVSEDKGLDVADGRGMLAGQGEVAFELWFGSAPQQGVMRQSLDA